MSLLTELQKEVASLPLKNNAHDYERASGSGLHEGHRERMRNKFKLHGERVFETHELMEMLLYHIIPCKDTNPSAWRLMKRFSTLDGVAEASKKEICSVDGIGERTAEFLAGVFDVIKKIDGEKLLFVGDEFLTSDDLGRFFIDYYQKAKERERQDKYRIVAIMLDSNKRVLSVTEPYNVDAGSGIVVSKPFIDAAIAAHASAVIIAHNHPYSSELPSNSDKMTHKLIFSDLERVGITLVKHFVISGYSYSTIFGEEAIVALGQDDGPEIAPDGVLCFASNNDLELIMKRRNEILFSLLSLVLNERSALKLAGMLSWRFKRLNDLFTAELYVLKRLTGNEKTAIFLKLFFAIYIRRMTDRFTFGKSYTEEKIAEYLINMLGYEPLEKVYIMLFDARGRAMSCEFVSEGTVDRSDIPVRRLVEIAKRNEAAGAVVVHNHPSGGVSPSERDKNATSMIENLLESSGIKFLAHYIVSHNGYCIIKMDSIKLKKDIEFNTGADLTSFFDCLT